MTQTTTNHRALFCLLALASWVFSPGVLAELPKEKVGAFFSNYCFQCHGDEKQKADLNLKALLKNGVPQAGDRDLWAEAAKLLAEGEMPPRKQTATVG